MLYITSDHAGFSLKDRVVQLLKQEKIDFDDLNPHLDSNDDYPDKAEELANKLKQCHSEQSEGSFSSKQQNCHSEFISESQKTDQNDGILKQVQSLHSARLGDDKECFGIAICGTGQGICMAMNRFSWIRAGLVDNPNDAEKIREHNHANTLCLPGPYSNKKFTDEELLTIIKTFLKTPPNREEKHTRRVVKLSKLNN